MKMRKYEFQLRSLLEIADKINLNSNSSMVEVGCYRGESTSMWASFNGTVYAVDSWRKGTAFNICDPKGLWQRLKSSYRQISIKDLLCINYKVEKDFDLIAEQYDNIKKIKLNSKEASDIFGKESVDFVYLDAMHDYDNVKADIKTWLPKIVNDGWIGGHDYHQSWPGVIEAVDEKFGKPDYLFEDTSWLKKL